LAFSPDGKKLVSDCYDLKKLEGGIAVWDANNGKILRRISTALGEQGALRFAPDSQTLAAFSGGAAVQLWDVSTGKPRLDLPAHVNSINTLSFTPDGRYLVSAAESIRVWETGTGRHQRELPSHGGGYNTASVLPNGREVLSGGTGGLLLQEIATSREVRRFAVQKEVAKGLPAWVHNLAITPDGKSATSFSVVQNKGSTLLQVWDFAKDKPTISRSDSSDGPFPQFSPDGMLLARYSGAQPRSRTMPPQPGQAAPPVEGPGSLVTIQDVMTGKTVLNLPQPGATSYATAFTPDGQILATTTFKQTRGPVNMRPGPPIESRPGPTTIHLWELLSGKEQQSILLADAGDSRVTQMAFSPDQRVLATAGQVSSKAGLEPAIQSWDVVTGKDIQSRKGFESEISCLTFSADGKFLASGHADGTILIWDVSAVHPTQSQTGGKATSVQMESWWADLADEDARKAEAAIWRLVGAGQPAVDFLSQRLHPAAGPPTGQIKKLIADLDSNDFQRREEATRQLAALEELAQPALKEALRGKPSAEQRRRIEKLREPSFFVVGMPEKRQQLRAIRVLERIGNSEARKALGDLAQGAPEVRTTVAAKTARERLERITPPKPSADASKK
jgi:WD40 repeat protein